MKTFRTLKPQNILKTILPVAAILLFAAIAMAVQDIGSKEISLDGGKKGNVSFPHHLHQDSIKQCDICHDIFPKKQGSIKDLKNSKKLTKKQVMNKTCLKCHRAMKKSGKKTGPTSCSKCHM